jgi:superfamily II DNA or RNA helicase
VDSIRPHLNSFTPAELYLLFQQNGLLNATGKGKSFVKALATGRFPIEEINQFVTGKPSLVDKFLEDSSQSLEVKDLSSDSVGIRNGTASAESDPDEVGFIEENLPTLGAAGVLSSLDSHILSSADEEAVEFLLASAVAKLWALAYRDEVTAVIQAQSFSGGDYALKARDRFLGEIQQARALPIPDDYQFHSNGKLAKPNLMQRHFAVRVLNNSRVGNWSGTGAGKTLAAIYAARLVDSHLTVICCPNSVVSGWGRSIKEIFPNSDVHTKTWKPQWAAHSTYRYLILNYEMFQQENSPTEIKALVETEQIDFLVIDEIHFTKQRSVENLSKRRENVTALASLASQRNKELRVLGLSATPVINNLHEGRSLIDLVTGVENDDLEVSVPSVANCMRMHQRLTTLGIRWMPQYDIGYDQIEIPIDCDSSVEEIRTLGKSGSPLELEKILTRARLPVILSEVRRKTLIYTYYVQGIDRILRDALVEAGWSVGFYTGEDKSGLEAFIEGDLDVLIGSSAISTGVDRLQHVCNRLIVNVLPWTAAEFEQLKGRIFRQGQASDRVTLVIPLTYSEVNGERWSWCEAKMQRLRFKKSVADAVVDGVVPEGHLRSPAQAYRDVMTWLERLESGVVETIARRAITISLDELTDAEAKNRASRYGDFSEMNRRWNVSHSETTSKRLAGDPQEWQQYHHLYREARKEWALVPYEEFIRWAEKRSGYSIGDFGCGEALVSKSLAGAHTVHSFDHVAINSEVVACDMAKVPLDGESLDVALYCLSLMGTNVTDYLREAYRVLKLDGHLHIWEPTSRFGDLTAFKASLKALGFDLVSEVSEWKFTHFHLLKSARGSVREADVTFNTRRKSTNGESA